MGIFFCFSLRWGTKIDAVVKDVKALLSSSDHIISSSGDEPPVKCIVFSQWADVLRKVEIALKVNGVLTFAMLSSGARTLENFKKSTDSCALLLPLLSRNNGLNLTEATHVFLMEPMLTPSIEAQAVARVRRLNQTKETFVHRYWYVDE